MHLKVINSKERYPNKRMQSQRLKRYALSAAADPRRYAVRT